MKLSIRRLEFARAWERVRQIQVQLLLLLLLPCNLGQGVGL